MWRERPARVDSIPRTVRPQLGFHQDKIADIPLEALKFAGQRTSGVADQGDVRKVRSRLDREASRPQAARQPIGERRQAFRDVARCGPHELPARPVTRSVEAKCETGDGPFLCERVQLGQLLARHAAEERERHVQLIAARETSATASMQMVRPASEVPARRRVRPEREEEPCSGGRGVFGDGHLPAAALGDQHHRFGNDAFPATDEPEALGSLRLHVHR